MILKRVVLRLGVQYQNHSPAFGYPNMLTTSTFSVVCSFLVPILSVQPCACFDEHSLFNPEKRALWQGGYRPERNVGNDSGQYTRRTTICSSLTVVVSARTEFAWWEKASYMKERER